MLGLRRRLTFVAINALRAWPGALTAVGEEGICSASGAACNRDVVQSLEPAALFGHFAKISSIPRRSRKEEKILSYIKDFASSKGLAWKQDATGNLLVHRPGCGGGEAAEAVMLQCHVDMVCEKNSDTPHNFDSDPIRLRMDDGWLKATGTTLGSDNGIGVAAALAVLEQGPEVKLPPVEALFTIDEETGLNGASGLDGSMVTATRMLNLDSEEFGNVYIGCAGGATTTFRTSAPHTRLDSGMTALTLKVRGLRGGHSGVDIHENRANALVFATAMAADALTTFPGARLVAVEGGELDNAIPREAHAIVAVPTGSQEAVEAAAAKRGREWHAEYGLVDGGLAVFVEAVKPSESVDLRAFSKSDSHRIISFLRLLPHGVLKMSHAMEGLVETSSNFASVRTEEAGVRIVTSQRSSLRGALEDLLGRMQLLADLAGFETEFKGMYPGWAPQPSAPLVNLTVGKLGARSGTNPIPMAIHAGLECGILLERCPTVKEAVSFGPTIVGAHSPDEALEISTVQPFFEALLDILGELAGKQR